MAPGNYLLLFCHFVYTLSHTVRMKLELISKWLGYFQPSTQNISAVLVYNYTVVVIHIWTHEFCTRPMGPVRSNLIESLYVATFPLNQDQQLKSNILVKSVRGMFVQIGMLSYLLFAKPCRMQDVSDLLIHNSNTTWTIRISTRFVTGVACLFATTLI